MPYATKPAMIESFRASELIQLTNEDSTATTINDVSLNRAMSRANADIDGYLAGRYALPLASVPQTLVGPACDIARYHLYDDRATEQVAKRYDDAIKLLRDIAAGKVSLGLDEAQLPTPQADVPQSYSAGRVFGPGELSDYTGAGSSRRRDWSCP